MEQGFQVLLQVFGGLALFLYGTDSLCRAVQQGAGRRLRGLLARCTANPAAGLLSGAAVTAGVPKRPGGPGQGGGFFVGGGVWAGGGGGGGGVGGGCAAQDTPPRLGAVGEGRGGGVFCCGGGVFCVA